MDFKLSPEEVRVLGSLIEKEITTPEYYPLSLNALMHACNQKTSRDPVVSYDENFVIQALDGLREKKLTRMVKSTDSRVAKYRQVFTDTANLTQQELVVLCVLMLRGPQTAGELRGRTERLHNFESYSEVEIALQRLMEREPGAMVLQLPRQPGTKEPRYAHLLSGEIQEIETTRLPQDAAIERSAERERISKLEQEVERLCADINDLKQLFTDFKKQFE